MGKRDGALSGRQTEAFAVEPASPSILTGGPVLDDSYICNFRGLVDF